MARLMLALAASSALVEGLLVSYGVAIRPVAPQLARQPFARMAEQTEAEEMSEEEYLAELEREQADDSLSPEAKKVYWNMRSESGVEFAPWMKVDPEAIARAEAERKARKERQMAAAKELDTLSIDPQAAELGAGGGLKSKIISEDEVELKWSTGNEEGNAGFIVQRRKGGSDSFEDLATFENFAPLKSKGVDGGSYTYLDDTVPTPGTWVYRILDCDTTGKRSAVCQKLVEIDSQSEQTFTLAVGGVIGVLALALVAAGIFADPIQTTSAGRGSFF
mmetsp:Transcript_15149/g.46231  ORF Transcript_15149/g.46231 Transcript_15149/m.46231 type:complete len:277 (-) Transcript_15149:723-1553(-)